MINFYTTTLGPKPRPVCTIETVTWIAKENHRWNHNLTLTTWPMSQWVRKWRRNSMKKLMTDSWTKWTKFNTWDQNHPKLKDQSIKALKNQITRVTSSRRRKINSDAPIDIDIVVLCYNIKFLVIIIIIIVRHRHGSAFNLRRSFHPPR